MIFIRGGTVYLQGTIIYLSVTIMLNLEVWRHFPRAHSAYISKITIAPANWFTHFCIVTQSRVLAMEKARIRTMCVNHYHSNTDEICVCELVWRRDFYSVYTLKTPGSNVTSKGSIALGSDSIPDQPRPRNHPKLNWSIWSQFCQVCRKLTKFWVTSDPGLGPIPNGSFSGTRWNASVPTGWVCSLISMFRRRSVFKWMNIIFIRILFF